MGVCESVQVWKCESVKVRSEIVRSMKVWKNQSTKVRKNESEKQRNQDIRSTPEGRNKYNESQRKIVENINHLSLAFIEASN